MFLLKSVKHVGRERNKEKERLHLIFIYQNLSKMQEH